MKGAQDGATFSPGEGFAVQNPVHALGKYGAGILMHLQAARRIYARIFREALYRGIDPVTTSAFSSVHHAAKHRNRGRG